MSWRERIEPVEADSDGADDEPMVMEAEPEGGISHGLLNKAPVRRLVVDRSPGQRQESIPTRKAVQHLGLDIGTKTIIAAYEGAEDGTHFVSEINGYYIFERPNPFVMGLLNDPNRVRADALRRPAHWVQFPGEERIYVLGRDAEELAYSMNDTLRRPMAEGSILADQESVDVFTAILHSLLSRVEEAAGPFTGEVRVVYSTTGKPLNKDLDVEYHQRMLDLILGRYGSQAQLLREPMRESHSIILNQSSVPTARESGSHGVPAR
jgi:hypothetical protein